jgi:xylan 1,4-beta-xylosidase
VDVLLWHYRDDDVPGPDADVHLSITGLPPGFDSQAKVWRVDPQNGNAFTAWKAMGSPSNPTAHQLAQLVSASRMAVQGVKLIPGPRQGSVELERQLPLQGVELIELNPTNEIPR